MRILRFFSKGKMNDQLAIIGHALGCQLRLDLLRSLGEEGLTPTEAAAAVNCAVSTAHYHISILVAAGLARRKGRRRGCRFMWPEERWEFVCRAPEPTTSTTSATAAAAT